MTPNCCIQDTHSSISSLGSHLILILDIEEINFSLPVIFIQSYRQRSAAHGLLTSDSYSFKESQLPSENRTGASFTPCSCYILPESAIVPRGIPEVSIPSAPDPKESPGALGPISNATQVLGPPLPRTQSVLCWGPRADLPRDGLSDQGLGRARRIRPPFVMVG